MGPDLDLLIPLAGMITGIILGLPVIRAVTRAIEKKTGDRSGVAQIEALRDEVQELREGVESSQDLHDRLVDLEERTDFTERLLANPRAQPKDGGDS